MGSIMNGGSGGGAGIGGDTNLPGAGPAGGGGGVSSLGSAPQPDAVAGNAQLGGSSTGSEASKESNMLKMMANAPSPAGGMPGGAGGGMPGGAGGGMPGGAGGGMP